MIEILEKSSGNVLAMRIDGKLMHEDYEEFVPRLEALIKEFGSLRCYFEMTHFEGIEPRALWDEIKFDVKHCREIERCAIVGAPSWHHWMTKVGKAIFRKAEIKYFPENEAKDAWTWVSEPASCACASTGDMDEETDEGW